MNLPVISIRVERKGSAISRASGDKPVNATAAKTVLDLLSRRPDLPVRRDLLIEHLHLLNDHVGHLQADHLSALAQIHRLSPAEVYEVASFYHHFEIVRPAANGEYPAAPSLVVRVCDGIACELAGSKTLLDRLPSIISSDIDVQAVPCIGRCEQAPAAVIHQYPIGHATTDAIVAAVEGQFRFPVETAAAVSDRPKSSAEYEVLRQCLRGERSLESVLQTMEASGLRGLGGAGFPAGRKWRIVRAQPTPRLMAVNIDEGEPGTFKDRTYLERDPRRFIEGMLIAAWAVSVETIYIYLRDEYHGGRQLLERELAALRADPPMRDMPTIELRRGAGAYICGEESAMIESIEGKRGMPRLRPPYVAEVGLFGRPTLEHNFETLYWVPDILEKGAAWFSDHGRNGRKGLRSYSVSGRVSKPGVYLAPAGITLLELINEYCGGMAENEELYGYLPGGASGGILPASLANVPLDFDTLQPHGCFIGSAAIVVFSKRDRAVDVARNLIGFFEHESCGQCTPCRSGTAKVRELIATDAWNLPLLKEISQVMRDASICGLGQAAPNPVDCVIKYFPQELAPA